MKIWQAGELITKVETELDMSDETFIPTTQEKLDYINEGILNLERIIHTLHLDYFKRQTQLSIVQGTQRYSLPTDMYGTYIRKILYVETGTLSPQTGGNNYEVVKIRLMQIPLVEADEDYMYDVENTSAAAGIQLVLYPPPRETTNTKFFMFYIRQANRVTQLTDLVDIPEGELYMFSFLRKMYLSKDKGNPQFDLEVEQLKAEEGAFRATMAAMAPEATDGIIQGDYEWYEELY